MCLPVGCEVERNRNLSFPGFLWAPAVSRASLFFREQVDPFMGAFQLWVLLAVLAG